MPSSIQAHARRLIFLLIATGLGGLLDARPIGLDDWVAVAVIAVSLILAMEVYKALVARRLATQ